MKVNKQGAVLPYVIISCVAAIILTVGIIGTVSFNYKVYQNKHDDTQANLNALSAVSYAQGILEKDAEDKNIRNFYLTGEKSADKTINFTCVYGLPPENAQNVYAAVSYNPNTGDISISANKKTASYNSNKNLEFDINFFSESETSFPSDDFEYANYSKGNISMSGNAKIYGSAVSATGTISLKNSAGISGTKFDKNSGKTFTYTPAALPDAPVIDNRQTTFYVGGGATGTISADCTYTDIDIRGTANVNCNTDRILVTDSLNLQSNGRINLIGNGSLTIYVKDVIKINAFNLNTNGSSEKLNIYVLNPSEQLHISSTVIMNGNFYLKNDVRFSSGSSIINGNIVASGSVLFLSSGTVVNGAIYMPNANATINGNVRVNGYVVCNTITMGNSGTINFAERTIRFYGSSVISNEEGFIGGIYK